MKFQKTLPLGFLLLIISCSNSVDEVENIDVENPELNSKYYLSSCPKENNGLTSIEGNFLLLLRSLGYDADNDLKISCVEAEAIVDLDLGEDGLVKDFTGIESLVNLVNIEGMIEDVYMMNLYNNTKLESINFKRLITSTSTRGTLVLPKSSSLKSLISQGTDFTKIENSRNQANLEILDLSQNDLKDTLDISNCNKLKEINLRSNKLTFLKLSSHPELTILNVNNFTERALDETISSIDLDGLSNIENLQIQGNRIEVLNLLNNTKLKEINAYKNELVALNLSNNKELIKVNVVNNKIPNLDLSNNILLENLQIANNLLTRLDTSKSPKLEILYCNDNRLQDIIFSEQKVLRAINCENNLLKYLDLSSLHSLASLNVRNNKLTSLNIQNGNYQWFSTMDARENDLTCIQVDAQKVVPSYNSNWYKDNNAEYSVNCN